MKVFRGKWNKIQNLDYNYHTITNISQQMIYLICTSSFLNFVCYF